MSDVRDAPGTREAGGARLIPPLLRETVFRRYWTASTVSLFGDQVSSIAMPLTAVLALHASAASMGYLTALEWLPSLLFGIHAGAWVDRRGRRRETMILCDLGRFALFAVVPVCWALRALTLWELYAVVFAAGTLSIVFNVADSALFVAIVPESAYVEGQPLLNGSRAMSFVAGPSAGGLLAQWLTAPFAIVADALSFLGGAPGKPSAGLAGAPGRDQDRLT
ncbi:MAG: MFS transporter [Trebonia sp.]